jgi:hypothetical protein
LVRVNSTLTKATFSARSGCLRSVEGLLLLRPLEPLLLLVRFSRSPDESSGSMLDSL